MKLCEGIDCNRGINKGRDFYLIHIGEGANNTRLYQNGKLPETKNERCFHFADKSAAAPNQQQAVYFPAEELQEQFPDLKTVEVDEDEII